MKSGDPVSIDQSHELMAKAGTHVPWGKVLYGGYQKAIADPARFGEEFAMFINNGGRVVMPLPGTLAFTGDFDPVFLGDGWKIIAEDCDTRENSLPNLDLSKIECETCLEKGETYTTGDERINRLKVMKGKIRLGGRSFKTCWENRDQLPDSWKQKDENGNTRYIFFDGLVILSPGGGRCSLYLFWDGGYWRWSYDGLGGTRASNLPSAVLSQVSSSVSVSQP